MGRPCPSGRDSFRGSCQATPTAAAAISARFACDGVGLRGEQRAAFLQRSMRDRICNHHDEDQLCDHARRALPLRPARAGLSRVGVGAVEDRPIQERERRPLTLRIHPDASASDGTELARVPDDGARRAVVRGSKNS